MENMRKEVIRIQSKVRDLLDQPDHSAARQLNNEIQNLEDDLQTGKNKYSIEDRIKRIINILEGDASRNQIMDHHHLDMFKDQFEDMRQKARSL
jgi:hypothetical protein